ncbi:MAG: flagellar basal body rod protein FlgC [Candidatus Gastranaerophilales bacterium]|nr:flagellar basal body rod protein FlgC [Candidatus Gastranaerophilales bacterium]MCM1072185.1 flagellar basal body rod protein FlgC [Bacteroides sp.]
MSFNIFDIAGSGMTAQRVKMDTIASNIANIHTTRKPDGSKGVYIKKDVSFRTLYEDSVNRGFSNFSSNNPDAQFDPKTGNMLINASVAMNNGLVTGGVQVEQIYEREDGIKTIYDPSHPDADEEGYVDLPNVNIVEEMVDMIAASRAYEANATVAENVKTMMQSAMNI